MSLPQYFAQINDDNIVIDVAVVTHLFMQENPERYPGTWIETFINLHNKTYAGIGYSWNGTDFVAPVEPELPIEE
jgi:hypothetical protein